MRWKKEGMKIYLAHNFWVWLSAGIFGGRFLPKLPRVCPQRASHRIQGTSRKLYAVLNSCVDEQDVVLGKIMWYTY